MWSIQNKTKKAFRTATKAKKIAYNKECHRPRVKFLEIKFVGCTMGQHVPLHVMGCKSLNEENKLDVVQHPEALAVNRKIISHFRHNFRLKHNLLVNPLLLEKTL